MNRYARTPILGGKSRGTCRVERKIFNAVRSSKITVTRRTLKQGERLDVIAGKMYGSGTYWWIIAAASGIGWGAQVPPGTWIVIPTSLNQVMQVVL